MKGFRLPPSSAGLENAVVVIALPPAYLCPGGFMANHHGKILNVFCPLLGLACVLFSGSIAHAKDGPLQGWLTLEWGQRLDYALEARVMLENRLSEKDPLWSRYETTPELVWHYSPRYDFSIGYMNTGLWMGDDTFMDGHEAVVSTTVKIPVKDLMVTSRQRFQAGTMSEETTAVFRQQTRLLYTGSWVPLHLKPFLADEWFCDLTGRGITQNRLMAGLMYEINRAWSVSVWGMRLDQWNERDELETAPVVGLDLMLSF